jgi:glycosyltransferase involved in cell wall biosynthesis
MFSRVRSSLRPVEVGRLEHSVSSEDVRSERVDVLILDLDLPQPNRSGGHARLLEIAQLFADLGSTVAIGACNDLVWTAAAWDVPVGTLRNDLDQVRCRFCVAVGPEAVVALLRQAGPFLSVVWLSRIRTAGAYLDLVRSAAPNARVVFDSVDVDHVRLSRQASVLESSVHGRAAREAASEEKTILEKVDSVVAVSKEDASALATIVGDRPLSISTVPVIYDLEKFAGHGDRKHASWDLIFVGSFLHEPNVDAMRWFVERVVPRLTDLKPKIAVVGHAMPPDLVAALKRALVVYLGHVERLEELYANARVAVAPVRFGAGVKSKVVEAALNGLPIVGTRIAWEGIDVVAGKSGFVADGEEEFADAIRTALGSDPLRAQIVEESRAWLRAFGRDQYREVISDLVGPSH